MKRIAGIIVWNVYAWPITLLLLISYAETWNESPALTMLNFFLNMSALIALHLNVWDKEVGTKTSRKVYLLTFITWKIFYNTLLNHPLRNISLNSETLLGLLIWLPLYIAVFIFAFRNWEDTKKTTRPRKKIKNNYWYFFINTDHSFYNYALSIQVYKGFFFKNMFSRNNKPGLYIIPVERKIADIENHAQDNIKVNFANIEIKLPCKKIEKRSDSAKYKSTAIIIDKSKVKGICISIPTSIPPKDKYEKGTAFETYTKMLYMTPDQINFFSLTKNNDEKFLLLTYKRTTEFHLGSIYKFETSNVRGFQFINLDSIKKYKYVKVQIFDKNDNQYELDFIGFSQKEIDYTLASIRFRENEEGQHPSMGKK